MSASRNTTRISNLTEQENDDLNAFEESLQKHEEIIEHQINCAEKENLLFRKEDLFEVYVIETTNTTNLVRDLIP